MSSIFQTTLGEELLTKLQKAESGGQIFAILGEKTTEIYPEQSLYCYLDQLTNFDSVAIYQSKLTKIRIEYNATAIKELHQRLVGLKSVGEDNHKYKEKMIKKLNLLLNNHPSLDEMIFLAMAEYIGRGYGSVEKFKKELRTYL